MPLVAYIDESTDQTGTYVLGGHVGTVENWAAMTTEWRQLLPLSTLNKHGRREFKMVEMTKTPERVENIQPFFRLIEKYVLCSISVCFNRHELSRAVARIYVPGLAIDWAEFSNPYVLAFRCLMDTFHSRRPEMGPLADEAEIDFIFDEKSEAAKIGAGWNEYLASRDSRYRGSYGQHPTFRNSEEYLPLQAADLWAGWVRLCMTNADADNIGRCDFGGWKGNRGAPKAINVTWDEDLLVRQLQAVLRDAIGDVQT